MTNQSNLIVLFFAELSTMYRTMETRNYLTAEAAIEDVKNKYTTTVDFFSKIISMFLSFRKLKAFIWDSPRLEYEAAQNCELVTAGELFGRSSYGIALRKKDAWVNPLSHAILSLHERGFMESLDNKWIFLNGYVNRELSRLTMIYVFQRTTMFRSIVITCYIGCEKYAG